MAMKTRFSDRLVREKIVLQIWEKTQHMLDTGLGDFRKSGDSRLHDIFGLFGALIYWQFIEVKHRENYVLISDNTFVGTLTRVRSMLRAT